MRTKKELSELLIKAIKNDSLEEQETFVNALLKHCNEYNLFEKAADAEDAQMGVEIICQGVVIDSIHALNHTELMKADVIVKKVVDDVPKLMDAASEERYQNRNISKSARKTGEH